MSITEEQLAEWERDAKNAAPGPWDIDEAIPALIAEVRRLRRFVDNAQKLSVSRAKELNAVTRERDALREVLIRVAAFLSMVEDRDMGDVAVLSKALSVKLGDVKP